MKAKAGEYVIVAKRKGDKWYIGGMTNNRQQERTFELDFDFLKEGQSYRMTSFEDGVNANRQVCSINVFHVRYNALVGSQR